MDNNKVYKFPNGATLIYAHQNVNNITYATIGFSCGSKCDPIGKEGLSHILEHMLFHDTKTIKEATFQKLIKVTNSETNAFTSGDCIAFDFNCLNEHFANILGMHSNLVINRQFDDIMLEKEKKIVMQEFTSSINNSIISQQIDILTDDDLLYRFIKSDDKTSLEDILGTEESLSRIKASDLEKYASKYFISDNLIISVCTNLPFEEVKDYCEKYLVNKLTSNPNNIVTSKETKYFYIKQDKMFLRNIEGKETFDIKFIFKNNVSKRLDSMKFALLEHYIFQDFDGLLMKELRTKKQITYTSYFQEHKFSNFFLKELDILTDYRNAHEALNTAVDILRKLVVKGITQVDLNGFRLQMKNKQKIRNYSQINDSTKLFMSYLNGKKIFDKKDIYNDALTITLEEANDYFKETYGCSNVGIILSGDLYKVSNLPNPDELENRQNEILSLPPVFSNEYVEKKLEEYFASIISSMKYLPTTEEIISGFKLKYLILDQMPKYWETPRKYKRELFNKINYSFKLTSEQKKKLNEKLSKEIDKQLITNNDNEEIM